MKITWHGHNCFSIQGSQATVVTDPYSDKIGLKLPKLKADIVTISSNQEEAYNNLAAIEGTPLVCDWPGEYEKTDVQMLGLPVSHYLSDKKDKNIIFHIIIDGIKICHLGALNEVVTEELSEQIGDVDILLIPVGGGDVLSAKKAHEVVEEIDPKIVIPMHYQMSGLKLDLEPVGNFLKEVGKELQTIEQFMVKKPSELPTETTEFIVLEPKI